jgi:hypothetical protein
MVGSASKTEGSTSSQLGRQPRPVGLTLPHVRGAGEPAKTRAGWAFVSGVSLVSPCLRLRENRMGNGKSIGRGIVGNPARALGQVGQVQQSRGFQGETAAPKTAKR